MKPKYDARCQHCRHDEKHDAAHHQKSIDECKAKMLKRMDSAIDALRSQINAR